MSPTPLPRVPRVRSLGSLGSWEEGQGKSARPETREGESSTPCDPLGNVGRDLPAERLSLSPESERPSLSERLSAAWNRNNGSLRSVTQVGLFVIAFFATLWVMRSFFIPLAFALMMYFLMRPAVRFLCRLKLPKAISAALLIAGTLGTLAGAIGELAVPASNWVQRLPSSLHALEAKSVAFRRPIERISRLADTIERAAGVGVASDVPRVAVTKPSWLSRFLEGAAELGTQFLVAVIASYFLLLSGDSLLARLLRLLPGLRGKARALDLINEVERRMSQYLRTVSLINFGLGATLAIGLQLIGMPNPLLWGLMAAVLNYVPYLGPAVGILVVGLASFISFPTLSAAVTAPLFYLCLTSIEGNVITPMVLGRAFRISPIILFIWLGFWAWLWSVPGAILAVPLLMLLKIVCEQSTALTPLLELMRND